MIDRIRESVRKMSGIPKFVASLVLLGAVVPASAVLAREEARIEFEEAVAVYGPGLYPAITKLARCGDYRVFVVYGNGTDMLFMDRLVPVQNESTYAAEDGMSFSEFNTYEDSTQIEAVACHLLAPTKVKITGRAHSFHSERTFRFTLTVDVAKRSHTYEDTQPR